MSTSDIVELPLHLKWSGPRRYDLRDPAQRRRVYEVVLGEGGADDVRRFIDPDVVLDLLPGLVLPQGVRSAWLDWAAVMRATDRC